MDEKAMLEIASKIKNKTATKDEIASFLKEYTKLLNEIKEDVETK